MGQTATGGASAKGAALAATGMPIVGGPASLETQS